MSTTRYKTRRKQEIQTRAQKTEHKMSEPPPIVRHDPKKPLPDRVPLRLNGRTVVDVRVSKIEKNLEAYALALELTIPELEKLIAARRYTPQPAPKAVEPRSPSWYVSDMYNVPGTDFF